MKTKVHANAGIAAPMLPMVRRPLSALLIAALAGAPLPAFSAQPVTKLLYDAEGNPTAAYDSLGRTRVIEYDGLGRVVKTSPYIGKMDANGVAIPNQKLQNGTTVGVTPPEIAFSPYGKASYEYDGLGRLNKVTDPMNKVTNYTYNGFDQLLNQVSPDTKITKNEYYANGQIKTRTDANNNRTKYLYAANNRLRTVTYCKVTVKVVNNKATEEEADTYKVDFSYYPVSKVSSSGKLKTVTETQLGADGQTWATVSTLDYVYNALGGIKSVTSKIGDQVGQTVIYTLDLKTGHLASITYPSKRAVNFEYPGADNPGADKGRVSRVTTTQGGTTAVRELVTGLAYRPFGGVTNMKLACGIDASRSYDANGRLKSYALPNAADGDKRTLLYDNASRIVKYDHIPAQRDQAIGYDDLDRVKTFTPTAAGSTPRTYTYDNNGNRTVVDINGSKNQYLTDVAATTSPNQLDSIQQGAKPIHQYTYDKNGNIVGDGMFVYGYDNRNRLVTVKVSSGLKVADYQYNALGQRISKFAYGKDGKMYTTYFYYDLAGQLIYEIKKDSNNATVSQMEYLYFGSLPVAVANGNGVLYTVQADHLGAPRIITQCNTNGPGSVVWNWTETGPYGEYQPTGSLTMNLRFPGQYYDAETALYHNGFRDYNPELGRYVRNPDTVATTTAK